MEDQGMDEDEIDQAMKIAGWFISPVFMTFMALFGNIFFGAVFALIVAAFMKKEPPPVSSASA